MAEGIILAAGYSSRTNSHKLMLKIDGKSLICHAISSMQPYVSHIYVVTGHYHESLVKHVESLKDVTCIKNDQYSKGMFTSVILGAKKTKEDFFILPADCPFVKGETYNKLLEGKKTIRVPVFKKRRGHPIWISAQLKDQLINEPDTSNLKAFRDKIGFEEINVEDSHILIDVDTNEIYEKIKIEME